MARTTNVIVRPAVPADVDGIFDLWRAHGEGSVDVREPTVIEAAMHSGGLHVFEVGGSGLIATGGVYPYAKGALTEAGSSCWRPPFRSRGGAAVSIAFRAIHASFAEPGTVVVSELYERSVKSARVLQRAGFERLTRVPLAVHEHAFQANPVDPVDFWVLSPWTLPRCARLLLEVLSGGTAPGGDLTFTFSSAYGFDHSGVRSMIERLARGDMTMVGHEAAPPYDLAGWMALQFVEQMMNRTEFLRSAIGAHVTSH